jgi:hypothetical protein
MKRKIFWLNIFAFGIIGFLAKPVLAATSPLDIPATFSDFEGIFSNIVAYALGFAAIVLLIVLISGGFKFMTSGGDPKVVEGAKKTFTSAIFGLVIILFSFIILRLIYIFTGVDVVNFRIYIP